MAGDWIKMRTDLYRDPKVCVIADCLMESGGELARFVNQQCQRDMTVTRNVMRNVIVGALVSVWGVLRLRGKCENTDLICSGVTLSVLDDISDLPGFGDAMKSVGWVVVTKHGLVFPRFFEDHNVDPEASAKAKSAERQRRYRERNKAVASNVTSNVTNNVTVTHREEKRREESKTNTASATKVLVTTPGEFQPLALAESKLDPETPAAILASICVANSIRATAFHPLVVEWAREGITVEKLKAAIAKALMRKGNGKIPLAYLDPIAKINCAYCGYANGLLHYFSAIAAQTENFWCSIKYAFYSGNCDRSCNVNVIFNFNFWNFDRSDCWSCKCFSPKKKTNTSYRNYVC